MQSVKETDSQLRQIRDEVVACQKCGLYRSRNLPVVGQGSHQADIVFVGEAPGASEDKTGVPFCGQAGGVLTELLSAAGLKREDVYICNILKCRPPQNRDPVETEIKACTPYLERQLAVIKPKILGAMGNYAVSFLLKKYGLADKLEGISRIHGRAFETEVESPAQIIALYHPAVAVYNGAMRSVLEQDFKTLRNILRK